MLRVPVRLPLRPAGRLRRLLHRLASCRLAFGCALRGRRLPDLEKWTRLRLGPTTRWLGLAALALFVLSSFAFAQTAQLPAISLFAGTWTLNLSKSTYQGTNPPRSLTVRLEDRGDGFVVSRSEAVLSDGSPNVTASAFKCDGKDYPLVLRQGQSVPLSTACTATAAGTYEIELKQEGGQPIQKTVRSLAGDGRTMIDAVTAVLPDGSQIRVIAVLEKQ
jgi:hypothetical protein